MTTTDDEVDLSNADLLADSNHGVYIPQHFAQNVKRELVTGVSDEDYKVLEAGPDHEHYWDAWVDVLDNATIQDPNKGKCYLYQNDGDLWMVPEPPPTKLVLGHEFHPMTRNDWYGFAGADPGSYICFITNEKHNTTTVLILSPTGSIQEIVYEGPDGDEPCVNSPNKDYWRDWTPSDTDKLTWEHKAETGK